MKIYILLILLVAGLASCKVFSLSGRPDPNTSTSGTLGSVKATNGVLPLGESNGPRPLDTLLAKH
jgi:hypothetical protein